MLEHHGVKGMRWGVRRAQSSSGIKSRIANLQKSREVTKASRNRERSWKTQYKKRGSMSDAELSKVLNRLRMENEFSRLATEATASQRKKAKAYMNAVMNAPVGKNGQALKTAITKQVMKKATTVAAAAAM